MRWYDMETDVCMAISMIECSKEDEQVQYAEQIIDLLQKYDKDLNYLKNATAHNIEHCYKRWYDKNETLSRAFLYLKGTTKELQKSISREILLGIREGAA